MTKNNTGSCAETNGDEYFVLYESPCRTERIVLFRNVVRQLEYVMISLSLASNNIVQIISFNEYQQLIHHARKIQLYQFKEDNLENFHYFFGMTTSAFLSQLTKT
jgi:UV DNA damage repair endonuclease